MMFALMGDANMNIFVYALSRTTTCASFTRVTNIALVRRRCRIRWRTGQPGGVGRLPVAPVSHRRDRPINRSAGPRSASHIRRRSSYRRSILIISASTRRPSRQPLALATSRCTASRACLIRCARPSMKRVRSACRWCWVSRQICKDRQSQTTLNTFHLRRFHRLIQGWRPNRRPCVDCPRATRRGMSNRDRWPRGGGGGCAA